MYFSAFPKIFYSGTGKKNDHKIVTNLLRRVGVRAKVKTHLSLFDTYDVKEGETPEIIAHKMYGSANYHWIILLVYVNEKYSDPNGVHHYEISQSSGDTSVKIDVGTTNADYPTATAITNFEYEEKEQDKMRNIRILDPRYIGQLVTEYQSLIRESAI